jgi:alkylation response protein AidB-like acyl-CoA dehydrogenase
VTDYTPPIRDLTFVLDHVVDLPGICSLPGFEHVDRETVQGALEEFGRLCSEVIAPLNRIGDEQGSVWNPDGTVTTPEGFPAAYAQFRDAGWGAVSFPEEYGGGGFPLTVAICLHEMLNSANMSFSMAPLLSHGATDLLLHHGSEEQKEVYATKLISGEWTGTMNLTEPDAGSDVGALRTKAIPQDDGSYRISGTKIFITFGNHDLTEQIAHLVLARTPDAPPGTKGISCFIVPKLLLNDDGSFGEPNNVKVVSIEHKMGIKASPTCVMEYDEAVGYLIGEANAGMRYMFTMMNSARLGVGVEGLALSERAWQMARAYAEERRQGRAPGAPAGTSSAIIDHPDVRRMLYSMRALTEAQRALVLTNASAIDLAANHPDETERTHAQELADLLTPLTKAWCTDMGVEVTSLAVQIHGGMGFIEETGVAQLYRDARIAPIYEGTNGIQAMDLVGRKLPMRAGGVITDYLAGIEATAAELASADGDLAAIGTALSEGLVSVREATDWIFEHGLANPADALAGATPYLRMLSLLTGAWLLGKGARAARTVLDEGTAGGDDGFLEAKVTTARFFAEQLLPAVRGLVPAVTGGSAILYDIEPKYLG